MKIRSAYDIWTAHHLYFISLVKSFLFLRLFIFTININFVFSFFIFQIICKSDCYMTESTFTRMAGRGGGVASDYSPKVILKDKVKIFLSEKIV